MMPNGLMLDVLEKEIFYFLIMAKVDQRAIILLLKNLYPLSIVMEIILINQVSHSVQKIQFGNILQMIHMI